MGMGYGANCAFVLSLDEMKELLPKETNNLINVLGEDIKQFFMFPYDYPYESETDEKEIDSAMEKLEEAFKELTTVDNEHLTIEPGYHDPEDGSRYDEVYEEFFYVDNMRKFTSCGEKFKNTIMRKYWVSFG